MTAAAVQQQHGQFLRDTGIFGGITGDHNSLQAEDEEFDYKKHSVKSLVGHFSKVRPLAEIPVQYLPEQRIYNGDQAPTLNYLAAGLNASSTSSSSKTMMTSSHHQQQQASTFRSSESGGSHADMEASRKEYEQRKRQQEQLTMKEQQGGSGATTTTSVNQSSGGVELRSKVAATTVSQEQRQTASMRRQSLKVGNSAPTRYLQLELW
jgi:hypothetical protein